MAAEIFETGRLHVDPQVGPEIGNRRYAAWAANAFQHPGQHVLKCLKDGQIIAFMVVEQPTPSVASGPSSALPPASPERGLGDACGRRCSHSTIARESRSFYQHLLP